MTNAGLKILFFNLMVSMSTAGMADTIDTSGQEPFEQCGYCHEYDGNSRMPQYPKLAGQTTEYIKKQLYDFRSYKRLGQMQATAELLSDSDIDIVARYFSQQQITASQQALLTDEQYQLANSLFQDGDSRRGIPACGSCHGTQAKGAGLIPRLAGQHKAYLYDQLIAFKNGSRSNDPMAQMQKISAKLTETEIESLAGYLSRLLVARKIKLSGKACW